MSANKNPKNFFEVPNTQELFCSDAANIYGGADLEVYRHPDGRDWLGGFNFGSSKLSSNANNQITSVRVRAGRWRFFNWPYRNGLGGYFDIKKPGLYNLHKIFGGRFDDAISSLQRF
ncbi:MAG: hypothetical protein Kow00121_21920 [Elainellaceae cyanobacterium]